ncbi:MAG: tetratricopeptide repeat protein [Myxococcales bacterium]|nr:tetratricopeptide repeat protein [Myxococcales bacterium]
MKWQPKMPIFIAQSPQLEGKPWMLRPLLALVLSAALAVSTAPAAAADPKTKDGPKKGEVSVLKRAPDPKDAAKDAKDTKAAPKDGRPTKGGAKAGPAKAGPGGPEQRRDRERSSVEDIDDELSILRELLEIERGSETEADTLLEISYVLWDRALAYDLEAYDVKIETCINAAEDDGDKRRCKIAQQNLLEQGRAAKLDVVNHLKRIERMFPRFAKLDEVLYSLGYHLNELDRAGEAVDSFMRLVRKTPKSNYVPDSFLGIGNYYFAKNNGGEALKWYTRVLEHPDSAVFGWSLYYIAWVYYNTQNWDSAVKAFIRVLDYSKTDIAEKRGRVTFLEDAGKYLVRSWAEVGKPKDALAFFKRVAPTSEVMLLDMLALYYTEVSSYSKSNEVIDQLVDFAKEDERMVNYVALRLENSYKMHELGETVKSVGMLGNALEHGFKAADRQKDELEGLLAEVASYYHHEYEGTLAAATLEATEKIYRIYGEHFSTGKNAYVMGYNHALALFQLERWAEAAVIYEKVIDVDANGKFAEPSAHRALVCYIKQQNLNAETGTKAEDTPDLRPVALSKDEERVARACERYIDTADKNKVIDEDVPIAMFIAGRMYYQKNQFDKATALLGKYVGRFPEHAYSYNAAQLLISALWLGQDGKGLRQWVDTMIKDPRFNKETLGKTITEFKSNEEYNKCIELKDEPTRAAECLSNYSAGFKDKNPEKAAQALSGAARFYRTAKKRDKIIETYKTLATTFATDKRAPQSLFEIGEIYRESADFRQAADAYEAFVKAYPKHERVPQALATATRYRELLGDYDKVVEDGELFLQTFAKDKRAAEVAYNVTVQYINKGDWKGVIKASDSFLKRSEAIPLELQLAAMVNTGTAQFKLNMGDKGLVLFTKVVDSGKQMVTAGTFATLPQIGRDALVQALFMRGELEFEKVRALKGAPKNLEAATKLLNEKVLKVTAADAVYAEAEAAKNPKWTAASSSRRGRIWQDVATSLKNLPAPPLFAKSDELKTEWLNKMADKAAPLFAKAKARYRDALKKAAEIFAFDTYWAEARDNLKSLDPAFAELTDVKEFMVEAVPYKPAESGKPLDIIHDSRYRLFELSSGAAVDESAAAKPTTGDVTQAANPELAKAYVKLATAHLQAGQPREAIFAASYGIRSAPELKKSLDLWNVLASSYQALGQTRESLVALEGAAAADGNAVQPLLNAAAVTVRFLDFENTVRLLDEVLKREPSNYWARVTKPVAVRRVGEDGAKAQEALDLINDWAKDETRPELHYNRVIIATAVLKGDKAKLQQASAICKESLEAMGTKHALAKEVSKRCKGIDDTISFMP